MKTPELHASYPVRILTPPEPAVFTMVHDAPTGQLLCAYNFTDYWTAVPGEWALMAGVRDMHDALSDRPVRLSDGNVALPPYGRVWLR